MTDANFSRPETELSLLPSLTILTRTTPTLDFGTSLTQHFPLMQNVCICNAAQVAKPDVH